MATLIHQWVEGCRSGSNPRTIARVSSGWVVIGASQFVKGYCLLLPDPVVSDLNALSLKARATLMEEVSIVGDALLAVTDAVRINYEILGNLEPALHVHVFPRFDDEPGELRTKPVWFYDWDSAPQFDAGNATDVSLVEDIRSYLHEAGIAV